MVVPVDRPTCQNNSIYSAQLSLSAVQYCFADNGCTENIL